MRLNENPTLTRSKDSICFHKRPAGVSWVGEVSHFSCYDFLVLYSFTQCNHEMIDHCSLFVGGSLAKVAYLSEVKRIRPRHYSKSGSFSMPGAPGNSDAFPVDAEVNLF